MDEDIKEIKLDEETVPPFQGKKDPMPQTGKSKKLKIIGISLLVIIVFLLIAVGIPVIRAYNDGKVAYAQGLALKDAAKSQDLQKIQTAVMATRKQLLQVKSDLDPIAWTGFIPFFGGYTKDAFAVLSAGDNGLQAGETLVVAIEPYADILGLKGQGSFTGGTTEERIAKVVETLGKVTPQIDQVAEKLKLVRKSLDSIDPNRYPENLSNRPIRPTIVSLKQAVDLSDDLLTQARPMVKQLPELLGTNGAKKYMILFQNDAELRPTGGFITAYAIFSVTNGKIHMETSDDIYKLDDTISKHVAPPDPISRYLNVYGWRIRDSNFSPDFVTSMKVFEDLYASSTQKQNLDGIIAMDTDVLVKMMDVIGPIAAYNTNFTTQKVPQCDCPMIIYELEQYADQPTYYQRGSRKDIIGVLLQTLMQKAIAAPKNIYAGLFQAAIDEAKQKHILFYLHNADAQKGIEALGFAGVIKTYDGDYLHVNDANLGGAKSNLFIVPDVKQDTTVADNGASTTLTLQYKYPRAADNCSLERVGGLCLAEIYRDYVRVYLPKGAQVGDVSGFENKSTTFEDLGHTVVDGFFTVVPQGLARITIKYRTPGDFLKNKEYRTLIQKQPGTEANKYAVTVNGQIFSFGLSEDKELVVKL